MTARCTFCRADRKEPPISTKVLRILMAIVLGCISVAFVLLSYRWPVVGDAQIFHYYHLLMAHGFAPYRDFPDINMPGSHIVESWQVSLFGGSDLGARIYDFTLLGLLTLAMIVIALPYDWLAGFFAGVLFTLQHACNGGSWNAGERDEVMAVLIMIGYAFLFEGLRKRKPFLLLAFGWALGMASALKPTVAPLGMVLLGEAVWQIRRRDEAPLPYIAWGVGGALIAGAVVFEFLWHYHVFGDFLYCFRTYVPLYAGMDRRSFALLLRRLLPFGAWAILPFAGAAALATSKWRTWESGALLIGATFGALSYFAQGRGYSHHTYPIAACVLLWSSIEIASAARSKKRGILALAVAGIVAATFVVLPLYCYRLTRTIPNNDFGVSLESDLSRMGGERLNGRIQCLDVVRGCYGALYHLGLVQSTPIVGDILLFAPEKSPIIDQFRESIFSMFLSRPPAVIVVSDEWFDRPSTFDKVDNWPRFAAYLKSNYRLSIERHFTIANTGYRIYVIRDATA